MDKNKIHSITLAEAAAKIPGPKGERYVEMFKHGTLSVELYTPQGKDWQTPHAKDEVYVVVSGRGEFVGADSRRQFQPGDVLFVAAHEEHRFENFSNDFACFNWADNCGK